MARVQKTNEKPKKVKPQVEKIEKKPIAVKQESQKGDMFFKVVISIIVLAILVVLIWFLIDWLIGDQTSEDDSFNQYQYVSLADLQAAKDSALDAGRMNDIVNQQFKDALDKKDFIYIFIYNGLYENLADDSIERARHESSWAILNQILENGNKETEEGINEGFISFDQSIAVFLLDTSLESNLGWDSFVRDLDGIVSPVSSAPVVVEIDKISDASPITTGIEPRNVVAKLEDILEIF